MVYFKRAEFWHRTGSEIRREAAEREDPMAWPQPWTARRPDASLKPWKKHGAFRTSELRAVGRSCNFYQKVIRRFFGQFGARG